VNEWRVWFDKRLDEAIEAAEVEAQLEGGESKCRSVLTLPAILIHTPRDDKNVL
jgi:hypothetical protein